MSFANAESEQQNKLTEGKLERKICTEFHDRHSFDLIHSDGLFSILPLIDKHFSSFSGWCNATIFVIISLILIMWMQKLQMAAKPP